jgi:hypothetical protein
MRTWMNAPGNSSRCLVLAAKTEHALASSWVVIKVLNPHAVNHPDFSAPLVFKNKRQSTHCNLGREQICKALDHRLKCG